MSTKAEAKSPKKVSKDQPLNALLLMEWGTDDPEKLEGLFRQHAMDLAKAKKSLRALYGLSGIIDGSRCVICDCRRIRDITVRPERNMECSNEKCLSRDIEEVLK